MVSSTGVSDYLLETVLVRYSFFLLALGMDLGPAVSAMAAGLASRASSKQASRLLLQQYKNAASFCCLNKGPMVAGGKISLLVTIKTMRPMACKVTEMMEVVLSILLGH